MLFPWGLFSTQTGCTVMLMEANHLFLCAFGAVAPPPPDTEVIQRTRPDVNNSQNERIWHDAICRGKIQHKHQERHSLTCNSLVSLEIVQNAAMIPLCRSFICSVEVQRLRQREPVEDVQGAGSLCPTRSFKPLLEAELCHMKPLEEIANVMGLG